MKRQAASALLTLGVGLIAMGCNYGIDGSGDAAKIQAALLAVDQTMPSTLADTHLFRNENIKRPTSGVQTYDVKVPLWSDGARKQRFVFVPTGEHVQIDQANGNFKFPIGTTLAKHFTTANDPEIPIETRVMTLKEDSKWYFATYVWSEDHQSTQINSRPRKITKTGVEYRIPSEQECKMCHNNDTPVLGFSPAQLDLGAQAGKEQISKLIASGVLAGPASKLSATQTLADIKDSHLSASERARTYMAVNCAPCHHPNGVEKANRYDFRLSASDNRLLAEGKVVPGRPAESIMWKLISGSTERMPLISLRADPVGVELLGKYIEQLPLTASANKN